VLPLSKFAGLPLMAPLMTKSENERLTCFILYLLCMPKAQGASGSRGQDSNRGIQSEFRTSTLCAKRTLMIYTCAHGYLYTA
jgi:hypothetical protein